MYTKTTPNYNLPQYQLTDRIDPVADFNPAFAEIDKQMKLNADGVGQLPGIKQDITELTQGQSQNAQDIRTNANNIMIAKNAADQAQTRAEANPKAVSLLPSGFNVQRRQVQFSYIAANQTGLNGRAPFGYPTYQATFSTGNVWCVQSFIEVTAAQLNQIVDTSRLSEHGNQWQNIQITTFDGSNGKQDVFTYRSLYIYGQGNEYMQFDSQYLRGNAYSGNFVILYCAIEPDGSILKQTTVDPFTIVLVTTPMV